MEEGLSGIIVEGREMGGGWVAFGSWEFHIQPGKCASPIVLASATGGGNSGSIGTLCSELGARHEAISSSSIGLAPLCEKGRWPF